MVSTAHAVDTIGKIDNDSPEFRFIYQNRSSLLASVLYCPTVF